jgi:prophage antirepressor-like protein
MEFEQQKNIISKKVQFIDSGGLRWMRANPFGEALGVREPAKFIAKNVPFKHLTSYEKLKSDASFSLELHPATKFISPEGLCELLNKFEKTSLLAWIQKEYLLTPVEAVDNHSVQVIVDPTSSAQDIEVLTPVVCDKDIIKIYFNNAWWMRASPFAGVLGYADCMQAVRDHVSSENQVEYVKIKSYRFDGANDSSRNTKTIHPQSKFINESGLFELIRMSRKPNAKLFQKWVTNDLLPTLRRDSKYHMTNAPPMVQQQMSSLSSVFTPPQLNATQSPQIDNAPLPLQIDDNMGESSTGAPPVQQYEKITKEVIKIYFNDTLWMLAKPFAKVLDYSDCAQAIRDQVSSENQVEYDVTKARVRHTLDDSLSSGRNIHPQSKFINEAGLFELIGRSTKPNAKHFQKWVTNELLPTLRHDSQYHKTDAPPVQQ